MSGDLRGLNYEEEKAILTDKKLVVTFFFWGGGEIKILALHGVQTTSVHVYQTLVRKLN